MSLLCLNTKKPSVAGFFLWSVLIFVFSLAILLTGCATPQVEQLRNNWPNTISEKAEIQNIPFYPQEDYECGPAALAMVFHLAGVHVRPEQLVDQVYLPGRKGSLQIEMQVATRRNGLVSHVLSPSVSDVLKEVAAGHPVIVFQNISLPIYPVWHYAVVVGFDKKRNVLILNSGRTEHLEMSLYTFERTWARGDYWAMLALSPSELPITADPSSYAQSIVALEKNNVKAAQLAYQTALTKWPEDRTFLLGLGNTSYALKQKLVAKEAYLKAVQLHPQYADAWNNLAQTQFESGEFLQALQSIETAIALGGVRLVKFQELKLKIVNAVQTPKKP
jgi:hypothetical protein